MPVARFGSRREDRSRTLLRMFLSFSKISVRVSRTLAGANRIPIPTPIGTPTKIASRTWSNSDTADFPVVYGGNYGGIWSGNQSHEIGFRDGALVAREDIREGKPYNPNPRGRYEDRARDYRGQYASGYRAGYESTRGRY